MSKKTEIPFTTKISTHYQIAALNQLEILKNIIDPS